MEAMAPASMEGMEHIDTVIIDGRIAMVDHPVHDDEEDSLIGVQHLRAVPTFRGERLTVTDEFAFSPAMEERLGWGEVYAGVSYALSDSPIDPRTVAEDAILSYYGLVDREYAVSWSDTSGYLWTDERFAVGGHSILDILRENLGRHVHMEIELYHKSPAHR